MNKRFLKIKKALVITMTTFIVLMVGFLNGTAYAYPVPELPADNLIVNPWFRNLSDLSDTGFDGWVRPLNEGVTWGPSQKESNPSPDIVVSGVCGFEQVYCGTAARWAEQSGILYPYIDVYAYQVVAANPTHRTLKFFTYYVSHIAEVGEVNIYAGESPEGPWEIVWVPLRHTQDELIIPETGEVRDLWEETGFLEWTFEEGHPYYKVEIHSRLPESPTADGLRGVGFKITGIYFSTAFTDEPGQPRPTPQVTGPSTSTTTAVTPIATENSSATPTPAVAGSTLEATSVAAAVPESNGQEEVATFTAEAQSPTEIHLVWNQGQNTSRGLRLERSLNMDTGWQSIATVGPSVVEYIDTGLAPNTVYYYRLRSSEEETSNVVSASTLLLPQPELIAPTSLVAISDEPAQVELSWNDLSDNETGYIIERSLNEIDFATIVTLEQNTTSYVDTPLHAAVYYYRVHAYQDNTFSDYSEMVSIKVLDRDQEGQVEISSTGSDSRQTTTPQAVEPPNADAEPGQNFVIYLVLAFVTLLLGIGLGVALTRRRA